MTNQAQAETDTRFLSAVFSQRNVRNDAVFKTGYNASHIEGLGDEIESVAQTLGKPVDYFDFVTILNQIAPEVTTRKLLLVGHSQGTFYTNEMYDYLLAHGVPTSSIAVYNLATPASFVAGGGTYLTSTNDKAINQIRQWDTKIGAPLALSPNVQLAEEPGYDDSIWGGHDFSHAYLAEGADRVVADIQKALSNLKAEPNEDENAACFGPPPEGIGYRLESATFAVADPLAHNVNTGVIQPTVQTTAIAIGTAQSALASLDTFSSQANVALNTAISDAFFSILPKPDTQTAFAAFAVEKALYGSSLTPEQYKALLNGENPFDSPDTPTSPQSDATRETGDQTEIPTSDTSPDSAPSDKDTNASPRQSVPSAGFGGGAPAQVVSGGGSIATDTSRGSSSSSSEATSSDDNTMSQTAAVPLSISAPQNEAIFGTTTVQFSGTTSPGFTVTIKDGDQSATTTVDASGNWSLTQALVEGTHSILITADDGAGNVASSTRTVTIDLARPDTPTLTVEECAHVPVPCLVTTRLLTLAWESTAHTEYYEILKNDFSLATTTATTSIVNVEASSTPVTFAIVAHAHTGQAATSSEVSVVVGTESDRSGAISISQVWGPSGNPYIITSQITVPHGVRLTIEPGTIIKILGASPAAISVSGDLVVGESDKEPVIITSLRDDSVLGDTNNDGTASQPAVGDWARIEVLAGGTAEIKNTQLRYGGASVFNPDGYFESILLRNSGGSVLLDGAEVSNTADGFVQEGDASSTILHSDFHDISEYGVWSHSGGSVTILSSTFDTENTNIVVQGGALRIGDDSFLPRQSAYAVELSGSLINDAGNSGNGITAIGTLDDNTDTTLPPDGLPYGMRYGSGTMVPAHASLTILPGAIFKSNGPSLDVAGTLRVGEVGQSPVVFTSIHDDSVPGSAPAVESAPPQPKDWQGITIEFGASTTIANARISYAGDSISHDNFQDDASLRNLGGTLSLDRVTIAHAYDTGIGQSRGQTDIAHLSFDSSENIQGIWLRGGSLSVHQSSFAGTSIGISGGPADATENWWGNASGPRTNANPSGTHAYLPDGVTFDPWLVCDPISDDACAETNQSAVQ